MDIASLLKMLRSTPTLCPSWPQPESVLKISIRRDKQTEAIQSDGRGERSCKRNTEAIQSDGLGERSCKRNTEAIQSDGCGERFL